MSSNGRRSLRKNHGRGHSYWIDGDKVPGITSVLGDGYPKPALVNWAADTTAGYAVDHWDDLAELPISKRLAEISRARWQASDEAKLRGTAVHSYAEQLAAGTELEIPDEYVGHVDAYLKFVHDWQPAELLVEQPVFSRRWRYAGTPDLVATLADGRSWLLDWKTTAKGVFLDHVRLLAAARYAEYTLDDQGNETPLPPIEATGIVWLRADGYDLIPVEANEQAHRLFLYVLAISRFVGDRDAWIGDTLLPGPAA